MEYSDEESIDFEYFLFENGIFLTSDILTDIRRYKTYKLLMYHFLQICSRLQLMKIYMIAIPNNFVDSVFLTLDYYVKTLKKEIGNFRIDKKKIERLEELYDYLYYECEEVRTTTKMFHLDEMMEIEFEKMQYEEQEREQSQEETTFNINLNDSEDELEAFVKLHTQFKRCLASLHIYKVENEIIPDNFLKYNFSPLSLFENTLKDELKNDPSKISKKMTVLRQEYTQLYGILSEMIESGFWPSEFSDIRIFEKHLPEAEKIFMEDINNG
jgi:hypothetical protein